MSSGTCLLLWIHKSLAGTVDKRELAKAVVEDQAALLSLLKTAAAAYFAPLCMQVQHTPLLIVT